MNHLDEEETILVYLGEASPSSARHLVDCQTCRDEVAALRQLMDRIREADTEQVARATPGADGAPGQTDPESMEAAYSRRVWAAIEGRLEPRLPLRVTEDTASTVASGPRTASTRPLLSPWGWAAATAVLVLGSFWLGRAVPPLSDGTLTQRDSAPTATEAIEGRGVDDPRAILRVALLQHLEGTDVLLREVRNARDPESASSLTVRADRLLANNRVFRLASRGDDPALDGTLDAIERWLLDVSHIEGSSTALASVQGRMAEQNLLLEVNLQIKRLDPALSQRPVEQTPGDEDDPTNDVQSV